MNTSNRHDRFIVILAVVGLTIAACSPSAASSSTLSPASPTNAPLVTATQSSPEAAISTLILPNEAYGFRLRYPAEYTVVVQNERGVCFTLSDAPAGCEVASAWLDVRDVADQTLTDIADELVAGANPTIEVTRTNIKIGNDDAILLDNIYGADAYRELVILHNSRFYVFTFVGWTEGSEGFARLQSLYSTLTESLTFFEQP